MVNRITHAWIPKPGGKFRNLETGLVRWFINPPRRGKWVRLTTDKHHLPRYGEIFYFG